MSTSERRDFLKKVFFYSSAGVLMHSLVKANLVYAEDLKMIDLSGKKRTDATNKACVKTANGIGYVDDLATALKNKKITKADKPGANGKIWKASEQDCVNCSFFNMSKKTPPLATCQLIPGCLVQEKGSCNTWVPKA